MSDIPLRLLHHLEAREGNVERVYLDSLDNPTCGVGHLLTAEENALYAVGDKVPKEVRDQWFLEDTEGAWLAAYNQANGIRCPEHQTALQEAFFHLNFQLGAGWPTKFKKTWDFLKAHDWMAASVEAADSNWRYQTPVRCADFMRALLALV